MASANKGVVLVMFAKIIIVVLYSSPLCMFHAPVRIETQGLRKPQYRTGRIMLGSSLDGLDSENWISLKESDGWSFGEAARSKLHEDFDMDRGNQPELIINDGGFRVDEQRGTAVVVEELRGDQE